jgi:hypothetical protein
MSYPNQTGQTETWDISRTPPYSTPWQNIMLLLHALSELDSVQWKYDVTQHIEANGTYSFAEGDFRNGAWSHTLDAWEPLWVTEMDRASRRCIELGMMHGTLNGETWQITNHGKTVVTKLDRMTKLGMVEVRRCYLWSIDFKTTLNPTYIPSPTDARRPRSFQDLIQLALDNYQVKESAPRGRGSFSEAIFAV